MVWYSQPLRNFPVCCDPQKGFGIVNKAEVYIFLELSCFFYDLLDIGNLISGSSVFSKSSLNISYVLIIYVLISCVLISYVSNYVSD